MSIWPESDCPALRSSVLDWLRFARERDYAAAQILAQPAGEGIQRRRARRLGRGPDTVQRFDSQQRLLQRHGVATLLRNAAHEERALGAVAARGGQFLLEGGRDVEDEFGRVVAVGKARPRMLEVVRAKRIEQRRVGREVISRQARRLVHHSVSGVPVLAVRAVAQENLGPPRAKDLREALRDLLRVISEREEAFVRPDLGITVP